MSIKFSGVRGGEERSLPKKNCEGRKHGLVREQAERFGNKQLLSFCIGTLFSVYLYTLATLGKTTQRLKIIESGSVTSGSISKYHSQHQNKLNCKAEGEEERLASLLTFILNSSSFRETELAIRLKTRNYKRCVLGKSVFLMILLRIAEQDRRLNTIQFDIFLLESEAQINNYLLVVQTQQ